MDNERRELYYDYTLQFVYRIILCLFNFTSNFFNVDPILRNLRTNDGLQLPRTKKSAHRPGQGCPRLQGGNKTLPSTITD